MNTKLSIKKRKKKFAYFRHHPFVVPVAGFLALFFIAMVAVIVLSGQTMGATDTRVVILHIDGKQQIVPTRAKTVGDLMQRLDITIEPKDIIEPAVDTKITDDNFTINVYNSRPVLVEDQGRTKFIETAEPEPEAVAQKAGLKLYPEDRIQRAALQTDPIDTLNEGFISERIVVERSTPVKLSLYGRTYQVRTHAKTVGEVVSERGINPTEETIFPVAQASVKANDIIFVTHPGKRIVTVEESIPQAERVVNDFSLPVGERRVKSEGRPGRKAVVYEIAKNGKTKKALREVVLRKPVDKVVGQGIQVIISNPSANVKLGKAMAASRGWTDSQWLCLYSLWQRESGWNTTAGNPTTGAYGIPQALPGSKMGPGWQSDPTVQIRWGLGYIAGRYGNPCNAWQFFLANNWY